MNGLRSSVTAHRPNPYSEQQPQPLGKSGRRKNAWSRLSLRSPWRAELHELDRCIRRMDRVVEHVRRRILKGESPRGSPQPSSDEDDSDGGLGKRAAVSVTSVIAPFEEGEEREFLQLTSRSIELILEIERREDPAENENGGGETEGNGVGLPYSPSLEEMTGLGEDSQHPPSHDSPSPIEDEFSNDANASRTNSQREGKASSSSSSSSRRLVSLLCDVLTGDAFVETSHMAEDCEDAVGRSRTKLLQFLPPISVSHQGLRALSDLLRSSLCKEEFLLSLITDVKLQGLVDLRVERYWYLEGVTRNEACVDSPDSPNALCIGCRSDIDADELMVTFVSFLKSLAKYLRPDTMQFFTTSTISFSKMTATAANISERIVTFPLFDRIVGLCSPQRTATTDLVRLSALHICLDIIRKAMAPTIGGDRGSTDTRLEMVRRYVCHPGNICEHLVAPVARQLKGLCDKLEEVILAMDAMRHRSGQPVGGFTEVGNNGGNGDSSPFVEIESKYLDEAIKTAHDMEIELSMLDDLLQVGIGTSTDKIVRVVHLSFLQPVMGKLASLEAFEGMQQEQQQLTSTSPLLLVRSLVQLSHQERHASPNGHGSSWLESLRALLSSAPAATLGGKELTGHGLEATDLSGTKQGNSPLPGAKAALIAITATFSNMTNKLLLRHVFFILFHPMVRNANMASTVVHSEEKVPTPATRLGNSSSNYISQWQVWLSEIFDPITLQQSKGTISNPIRRSISLYFEDEEMAQFAAMAVRSAASQLSDEIANVIEHEGDKGTRRTISPTLSDDSSLEEVSQQAAESSREVPDANKNAKEKLTNAPLKPINATDNGSLANKNDAQACPKHAEKELHSEASIMGHSENAEMCKTSLALSVAKDAEPELPENTSKSHSETEELRHELAGKEKQLQSQKKEAEELKKQLQEMGACLSRIVGVNAGNSDKLIEASIAWKKANDDRILATEGLRDSIKQSGVMVAKVESENAQLKTAAKAANEQLELKTGEASSLRHELQQVQESLESTNEKLLQAELGSQKYIEVSKVKTSELGSENAQLSNMVQSLQEQLKLKTDESTSLKQELDSIKQSGVVVAEVEAENAELRTAAKAANEQLQLKTDEASSLRQELRQVQESLESTNEKLLQAELGSQKYIEVSRAKTSELGSENAQLRSTVQSLQEQLKLKTASLKQELKEEQDFMEVMNSEWQAEMGSLRLSVEESKAMTSQLESEKAQLRSTVQSLKEQLQSKTDEAVSLRRELQEVKESLTAAKEEKPTTDDLKNENVQLRDNLSSLEEQLIVKIDEATSLRRELQGTEQSLAATNGGCEVDIDSLRHSIEQAKATNSQLEYDNSELSKALQSVQKQLLSKTDETISLRHELKEVQDYLGVIITDTAQTQQEMETFALKWKKANEDQQLEVVELKEAARIHKRKMQQLQSENNYLQCSVQTKETELQSKSHEIQQLNKSLQELKESHSAPASASGIIASSTICSKNRVFADGSKADSSLVSQDAVSKCDKVSQLEAQLEEKTQSETDLKHSLKKALKLLKKLQAHVANSEQEKVNMIVVPNNDPAASRLHGSESLAKKETERPTSGNR